jgi:hypothetical protein
MTIESFNKKAKSSDVVGAIMSDGAAIIKEQVLCSLVDQVAK